MKAFDKVWGMIGGVIFCLIISLVLVATTSLTLPIWPLSDLFFFLLPSLIVGSVLGFIFPKFFGWFTNFFDDLN